MRHPRFSNQPVKDHEMATSILTVGGLREVFEYIPETGHFLWKVAGKRRRAGEVAGSKTSNGYIRLHVNGQYIKAHRAAWLYVNGHLPQDQIDHINRDRTDNRIENLRLATSQENNRNRCPQGQGVTGFRGVTKSRSRFKAEIRLNYKTIHIGCFDTAEEAAVARAAAEKHLWGAP